MSDESLPQPGTRAHDILTKPISEADMPASRPSIKTLFWLVGVILGIVLIIVLKTHVAPMK